MLNKKDSWFILAWSKKIKAINTMGGECSKCGEKSIFKLEFHHVSGRKTYEDMDFSHIKDKRWSVIESEIKKCILVCRNCHADIHDEVATDERRRSLKFKLLEYKNIFECEECGHNGGKNFRSLDFHHRNSKDKKFEISKEMRKHHTLVDHIFREVEKCDVICRNCHLVRHINVDKFNQFKHLIDEKIKSYKESNKIDHDKILDLYKNGVRQIDIARFLNYPKVTVHWVLEKHGKI